MPPEFFIICKMNSIEDIKLLKSKMVCRKVDNEMVLVPLVNNVAEMKVIYNLNEVATFIWETIDEVNSIDEIADAVIANFDTNRNTAFADIRFFLEEINNNI